MTAVEVQGVIFDFPKSEAVEIDGRLQPNNPFSEEKLGQVQGPDGVIYEVEVSHCGHYTDGPITFIRDEATVAVKLDENNYKFARYLQTGEEAQIQINEEYMLKVRHTGIKGEIRTAIINP